MKNTQGAGNVQTASGSLPLPVFFPSISSVKTALPPIEYLKFLSSLTDLTGQYLVSAYDLFRIDSAQLASELITTGRSAGGVVLMDSGNYESFWKDARSRWSRAQFHEMLQRYPCDLAFCFDQQEPSPEVAENVGEVVAGWRADQDAGGSTVLVPIVHGAAAILPQTCAAVASQTGASMIAVAERRLGDGIFERAKAVSAIRQQLDRLGHRVALHLLGTGNPISIAVYLIMGADSFDGLEWCQTVVDHDSALLFHLSQADFFEAQTTWSESGLSFQARTLAHNLEFYADWMRRLRNAAIHRTLGDFCRYNLPAGVYQRCASALSWT
jgi:queuine/archaeosine tRNA-ribosyltransferase